MGCITFTITWNEADALGERLIVGRLSIFHRAMDGDGQLIHCAGDVCGDYSTPCYGGMCDLVRGKRDGSWVPYSQSRIARPA